MTFTISDFKQLMEMLEQRPEWRAELRRQILTGEFLSLPKDVHLLQQSVEQISESQERTDDRLDRLEVKVDYLVEGQQQTNRRLDHHIAETSARFDHVDARFDHVDARFEQVDARFEQVDARFEQVEAAQQRTERKVDEMAVAQKGLATAFGQLQNAFGSTIEEEAESVIQWILEEKGYTLLSQPISLPLNGEVDVILEMESPQGERVWVMVEAKARLGHRQVRAWGQKMHSPGWHKVLANADIPGPYLVYVYGIRHDPGSLKAAEEQGIGLAVLKGELVTPKSLIQPLTE